MDKELKTYLEGIKKDFEEKSKNYYLKYKRAESLAEKIEKFLEDDNG